MDPVSAVGLASAAAQFLDFGSKLFSAAKEFAASGSLVTVEQVKTLAKDLKSISDGLNERYQPLESCTLSPEEQNLKILANRCSEIAREVQRCLNELIESKAEKNEDHKPQKMGDRTDKKGGSYFVGWKSLRAAFCAVWNSDYIDELDHQLREYRSQLTLRLLLVLNAHYEAQARKLDQLIDAKDKIAEVVTINCQDMKSTMAQHHGEIVASILTTRDGHSRVIAGRHNGILRDEKAPDESAMIKTTYSQGTDLGRSGGDSIPGFLTTSCVDYAKIILSALHFRGMTDRMEIISEAHKNTFEWIWNTSDEDDDRQWHNLQDWLRHGTGCYWISGKAGPGKSCLMKYLQRDKRTWRYLKEWATDAESTILSGVFYFWYAGTSLQKSQTGLLRSLLFDVLSRMPEHCPVIFPNLCRSIISGELERGKAIEMKPEEVKLAFSMLIKSVPPQVRICFLVDGLDEYAGDHNEICDLFSQATTSKSIKIVVSSRPIPVCVAKFGTCPRLRLQDLTRPDITKYVWDSIGSDPLMMKMEEFENGVTARIAENIISKACGVFLWIVLVVKKIIVCLQNYDAISDLEAEIDKLPSDLEKLYDRLFSSMSKEHSLLGAKFLLLVLRSMEAEVSMTLLQMSFVENGDSSECLDMPVCPLKDEAQSWRCESVEGRFRSRCYGLVEAQGHLHGNGIVWTQGSFRPNLIVTFLHRTVVEFLQIEANWKRLQSLVAQYNFNTEMTLVRSALMELKGLSTKPHDREWIDSITWRLKRILVYGQFLEDQGREAFQETYLPELQKTLRYHWHDALLFKSPVEELKVINESSKRANNALKLPYPDSFVLSCLLRNPDPQLGAVFLSVFQEHGGVHTANMLMHFVEETDPRIRLSMAMNILVGGDSPRTPLKVRHSAKVLWGDHTSAWTFFLRYIHTITSRLGKNTRCPMSCSNDIRALLKVTLLMLNCNADLDATIKVQATRSRLWRNGQAVTEISSIDLIARFLWKIWRQAKSLKVASSELDEIAERAWSIETHISQTHATEIEAALDRARLGLGEMLKESKFRFYRFSQRASHIRRTASQDSELEETLDLSSSSPWHTRAILALLPDCHEHKATSSSQTDGEAAESDNITPSPI